VVEIVVPPLRERRGDIPDLVRHLLGRIRRETQQPALQVSAQAMAMLEAYDWPGNVRELENALTRASILARGATLGPEHLRLGSDRPVVLGGSGAGAPDRWDGGGEEAGARPCSGPGAPAGAEPGLHGSGGERRDWALSGAILHHVRGVLDHTEGNKSEAARLLGISRSRLARILERAGAEGEEGEED
jgi:DNA-binding NtrC family response regulator